MRIVLTVVGGPHIGREYSFEEHDSFIVGRSKNAHFRLPMKDLTVSRVHFIVEINPPYCRMMDMASRNGTFVNGKKVHMVDLKDGDIVRGGQTVFKVSMEGVDSEAKTLFFPPPAPAPSAAAAAREPAAGASPFPNYRIESELGRGGRGIVYLARRISDNSLVALKTITPTVAGTAIAVSRFLREASILRQLDHPNIVGFQDIGYADGKLYFVMEYVPGIDAGNMIRKTGLLAIGRAVNLICQILEGLAYAHAKGFVHRDVKPHNLLVQLADGSETGKLADFGLARVYQSSRLSGLTLTGQSGGTTSFIAPEQITNFRDVQPSVDLYAAGATLYYLLTGQHLFEFPETFEKQILTVLTEPAIPIRKRRPDVPEALEAVIARSLNKEPNDRYPDAAAMRQALLPFCGIKRSSARIPKG